MIPAIPSVIKIMTVVLAGSIVLSPVPTAEPIQAGVISKITNKIVNSTTKTIIDNAKEKQKKIDNPNYIPKRKLPIIAGYKPGKSPLPKSVTPAQTYKNIWASLKNNLGLK